MTGLRENIRSSLVELIDAHLDFQMGRLRTMCESPIEIAMGVSLLLFDRLQQPQPFSPLVLTQTLSDFDEGVRILVPQFRFEEKRIDFMLRDSPDVSVFIECDGHDFHERTKEQAARDRRRDRDLQRTGTPILRFTGSEIFACAIGCAQEIFDFVDTLYFPKKMRGTAV